MKKLTPLAVILFTLFGQSLYSQTYTFHFDMPLITPAADGYSLIVYPDCRNMGKEGTPELPYRGIDLLLPYHHEIVSAGVISVTFYPTEQGIKIKPASKPVPISHYDGTFSTPVPDGAIYGSADPFPSAIISSPSTNFLCGHGVASFTLCPVIYKPVLGEVQFIRDITIEIKTHTSDRARKATDYLKSTPEVENRINHIVDNPGMISDYPSNSTRDGDDYDLLLISNTALMPAFDDYVSYKISTGFAVKQVTTEEIYAQYDGQDDQDKIRNCIIDYYTNHGISYVILGGDADPNNPADRIIPHRGLDAVDDNDIASDMYYSNLDGNWNTDGDNYWGEPGEADLYSEVAIGRLCVDNVTEIANFTHKLFMYQNAPVTDDVEKALILGEELDSQTYGGTYKDEIVNGSSNNGYTTTGFPAHFNITKLYEMLFMWDKTDVFNQFDNAGVNLLNHLGHSNVDYNMKMYNSDLTTTNFTNDGVTRGYVIAYSQGCYNGSFDNRNDYGSYESDCFAEVFTGLETGEVACVANSRYGWYDPGGTNSSSQYYDRQFFDALFGEGVTTIGDMNAQAKEKDVSYINNDEYCRWVAYESNLFGDPSLDVWTAVPTDIVATYPETVVIATSDISFETDAPYARIAVMKDGILIGRAITDGGGYATVTFPPLVDVTPLEISIIAHNRNRLTGSIMVIAPNGPYVVYDSYSIDDSQGNGNGQMDYGETVMLSMTVKNVGVEDAQDVFVTISANDPYVTITDDGENFGYVPANGQTTVEDAFTVEVASDIPDGHQVTFEMTATDSQDSSWMSHFTATALAPVLKIGAMTISDPDGNGNNRLDPGETADVFISISNQGHSDAYEGTSSVTTTSPFLILNTSTSDLGTLATGESKDAQFNVSVDPGTAIGTVVDMLCHTQAGQQSAEKTFYAKVGLILEDWESGTFDSFAWTFAGNQPWTICQTLPYEGTYCARSGVIGNQQSSKMKLDYQVMNDDSISFYLKVSSEATYDFLQFYIDNVKMAQWSGEVSWQRAAFPVTAGAHTFTWSYIKDQYVAGGQDAAWIDYISLPPELVTTAYAGPDETICQDHICQLNATATYYDSLMWTTTGTGSFDDATIINPVYTPSDIDIEAGSVTNILVVFGSQGDVVSDNMVLTIHKMPVVIAGDDAGICDGDTYTAGQAMAENYTTLQWTTSGDGTFDDPGILTPVYIPGMADIMAGEVTLTLAATREPCDIVSDDMVLTINELPAPEISGEQSVCRNSGETAYTTPEMESYLYHWDVTGGTIEQGNNTNQIMVTWGDAGEGLVTLTVTVETTGCQTTVTFPVTINPLPEPMATGPQEVCSSDADVIYSTPYQEGHSYAWSATGGVITEGQDSCVVKVTWDQPGDGVISVMETQNATGCYASYNLSVQVNSLPVVNLGADTSICHNHVLTLNAGNPDAQSWLWSTGQTSQTITVDSTGVGIGGTKVIGVTVTDVNGCQASDEIAIYFEDCSGIAGNSVDCEVIVFPNPNKGSFTMEVNPAKNDIVSIRITNTLGLTVSEEKNIPLSGKSIRHFDLSNNENGLYYIIIKGAHIDLVKKVIIQK